MGKYVTQKELEQVIKQTNYALTMLDVVIEVLSEHYCKVDKNEFGKLIDDAIQARVNKINQINDLQKEKE